MHCGRTRHQQHRGRERHVEGQSTARFGVGEEEVGQTECCSEGEHTAAQEQHRGKQRAEEHDEEQKVDDDRDDGDPVEVGACRSHQPLGVGGVPGEGDVGVGETVLERERRHPLTEVGQVPDGGRAEGVVREDHEHSSRISVVVEHHAKRLLGEVLRRSHDARDTGLGSQFVLEVGQAAEVLQQARTLDQDRRR